MKVHYIKQFAVGAICLGILTFFLQFTNRTPEIRIEAGKDSETYTKQYMKHITEQFNEHNPELFLAGSVADRKSGYLSEKGFLCFPIDFLVEDMNCSVQEYPDGKLLIEKGSNTIVMQKESTSAKINDTQVVLKDFVTEKDETLYIPINEIASYLNFDYQVRLDEYRIIMSHISEEILIPAQYDMREIDRVSPVRDQGIYGTCWAFASLGALETTVLPAQKNIFSVDHMSLNNSFNLALNQGGEFTMAIAYLASWQGPVFEEDDPYGDGVSDDTLKARKHLEEAQIIGEKDYEGIKEAVYKYGGVQTSIYTQLVNADSWSYYYNRDRAAYYYNANATPNHDIVIVGWNDNYPKECFTIEPEGDGAFICKNSWGTEFGENGFFYVSYYDTNIGTSNVVYTKLGEAENFDHIYQADLLGWTGQLGYNKENAYFANVFKAGTNEELQAVAFYATGKDTSYEVYVVPEFQEAKDLNNRQMVASGKFGNAGYYTVNFDEAIPLEDGKEYAVVVSIKTPGSIHPVAIEYNSDYRTATFDITDGKGFISLYGEIWNSAEESQNCNICLKAFTNDRNKK